MTVYSKMTSAECSTVSLHATKVINFFE